jgi:hypothetical protein
MFDVVACETEARSCLRLAKRETDPAVKLLLRSMARSWIGLADQPAEVAVTDGSHSRGDVAKAFVELLDRARGGEFLRVPPCD